MGNSQKYADEFYQKFSKVEGNQHMSSLFALKKVIDLVKVNNPKYILEIGLGIGSISCTILEFSKREKIKIDYYGTERNEFCLEELPKNLADNYRKVNLYSDLSKLPEDIKFDFVIIDGNDEGFEKVKNIIAEEGVIFIEGDRVIQLQKIRQFFPKNVFVHLISNYKNPEYGPFSSNNWSGGGKLIYIHPNLKQKLHYIKERIVTFYRYKVRKIFG